MKIKKVYGAFFSAYGTTKKVTSYIAKKFGDNNEMFDFVHDARFKLYSFGEDSKKKLAINELNSDDLLIIGMPVFSGRIPSICEEQIKLLKGNNTPAIVLAVYGNRDYDDAALELADLVKKQGFKVIAAGAFIAEHSIFHDVAKNRPDEKDYKKMDEFVEACKVKIESNIELMEELKIKGNRPYKVRGNASLIPVGDENCISCGACVNVCPMGAIDPANPNTTDADKCISCFACVAICPTDARSFKSEAFITKGKGFYKQNEARKEPEWFI